MPTTIRFPFNRNTANHAAELNQIITILPTTATITVGGAANYVSIQPWKLNGEATDLTIEDSYTDQVRSKLASNPGIYRTLAYELLITDLEGEAISV